MLLWKKALVAFGVVAAVMAIGLSYLTFVARGAQNETSNFSSNVSPYRTAVLHMVTDFYTWDDQNNMYVLVAATNPSNTQLIEDTYQQTVAAQQSFQADLKVAQSTAPASSQAVLTKIASDIAGYQSFSDHARKVQEGGNIKDAARIITLDNIDVSNALMANLTTAQKSADAASANSITQVQHQASRVQAVAIVVGSAIAFCLVLLLLAFRQSVLMPLRVLVGKLRDVATGDGNLKVRLEENRTDEMGQVASAFNLFVGRMHSVLTEISGSATSMLTASKDLTTVTGQADTAAQESSARTEEVSAATEEVTEHIRSVASGAEEMGATTADIARSAGEAASIASDAQRQAELANERVRQLSSASAEIASVVSLISAVTEQTNLLALNATIEAARAGDAGKGFAVVASEVKDLAAQTATAAGHITEKVTAIRAETDRTVQDIARITEVINNVSSVQDTIAAAVQEQNSAVQDIARSAVDATSTSQTISESIKNLSSAAQQTSAGMAENSSTIAELTELATHLNELVGTFEI
jgi:methyl-accepting chemotaxis protein